MPNRTKPAALHAAVLLVVALAADPSPTAERYQESTARYKLPRLSVTLQTGETRRFPDDIDDGRPVVLNFVFASCSAICPLLSQSFAKFQQKLGPAAAGVHMVSISIDPEADTPAQLTAYAQHYQAGPNWSFYTGSRETSIALQKAFAAYYRDKMNHRPLVFMRRAPGRPWVRLEGFLTGEDLLHEFRELGTLR